MKKRKYTKTRRAESQDETRERIVEATVKLHETLGPANTSIKAIAEKAGVQRLTVYRHFPDDTSLFQACTSHYFGLNPPPDMTAWAKIQDASDRSYTALVAFYRYYHQTEKMFTVAYRDIDEVKALHKPMAQFEAYLDQVCDDLVKAWNKKNITKKQLQITLRHALRFSVWQSLHKTGLKNEKMAELVQSWLTGIL
ncbi:MAG: TetR/AcrR family transcriptional regulator [Gammaproteobacteria bacterium]|nr:TetR/AcrR family transcriptional regulator [Gammaproteobacteria bacterium]